MNIYPIGFEKIYEAYPLTLVDIGASGGILPHWMPHRRHLRVIGFEPDTRAFEHLERGQNSMIRFFNIGLHRQNGQLPFYLTRKQKNSSFFLPNRDFLDRFQNAARFDILKETTIACNTLDEVLQKVQETDVDFIKLDTQGSEMAILQGAAAVLKNSVFGLEVEVAFTMIYKDEPLFADVDLFIRQYSFDLIDLRATSWKRSIGAAVGNSKGQLISADALYFRRPLMLQKTLEKSDPTLAKSKLVRALSICQIYGFLDYGLELLDIVGYKVLNAHEVRNLQKHLRAQAPLSSRVPNFPGRKALADLFTRISSWLAPCKNKFKQPPLGNF